MQNRLRHSSFGGIPFGGGGSWNVWAIDHQPTNLVLVPVSDTRIDGTFTIVGTGYDGHKIYVSTDGVSFVYHTDAVGATFSATGLNPLTPYYVRVYAYKGSHLSLPDEESLAYPLVVYDGNTVAWYKHNDPVAGVVKDGANRVSGWLDKMNYGLGGECIADTNFTTGIPWTVSSTPPWTVIPGVGATYDDTVNAQPLRQNHVNMGTVLIPNTNYEITFTVDVGVGEANIYILNDNGVIVFVPQQNYTSGTYKRIFNSGLLPAGQRGISFWAYLASTNPFTITYVSVKQVLGNTLYQQTVASQPVWSLANGVLFDGANDFMQTLAFVYNQPELIYFVGRQVTWTAGRHFFDGLNQVTASLIQNLVNPNIRAYAGGISAENVNLPLNTFGIIRTLFNGVNSSLQVNKTAPIIGNFGAINAGGFTLGSRGVVVTNYGNIQAKEIILRKSADNADTQNAIYNYLATVNSIV